MARGGGQVDALGAPKSIEELQIRAGAAAAVQHPRRSAAASLARGVPEQRRDESAEAAEPEMTRFRSRGRAQQAFHAVGFSNFYGTLCRNQGVTMTGVRRLLSTFALVAAIALTLSACHKKVPPPAPAPPPPPPVAPAPP